MASTRPCGAGREGRRFTSNPVKPVCVIQHKHGNTLARAEHTTHSQHSTHNRHKAHAHIPRALHQSRARAVGFFVAKFCELFCPENACLTHCGFVAHFCGAHSTVHNLKKPFYIHTFIGACKNPYTLHTHMHCGFTACKRARSFVELAFVLGYSVCI